MEGEHFPLRALAFDGRWVEIESAPRRVLATSASSVDLVLDLVGPGALAALPVQAETYSPALRDHPAPADLPRFERYTAEGLLGLAADLVLVNPWAAPEASGIFARQGVPVVLVGDPIDLGSMLEQLEAVGRLLGAPERAAELGADLERRVAALQASPRAPVEGRRPAALAYSHLGTGAWTAGAETLENWLFELAGLDNAAAQAGIRGHVPLEAERLLAIDPDWILVPCHPQDPTRSPTRDHLRSDTRLAGLAAVRADRILVMPTHFYGTSSHRVVDSAEALVAKLKGRESRDD